MANDEHVAILKKGVDAWNKWRDERKDIRPDLSNANLRNVELSWADVSMADISRLRGYEREDIWFSMWGRTKPEHFKRYPWVLETYRYPSSERLIADLGERVIDPAEKWRSVR